MRNLIITLILLTSTIALICLIRLMTALFRPQSKRPRVELRVFFDDTGGCLEYLLGRMFSAGCFRDADLQVTVIDCVNTDESRRWLDALRVKLRRDFNIERLDILDGEKCERTGERQHGDD